MIAYNVVRVGMCMNVPEVLRSRGAVQQHAVDCSVYVMSSAVDVDHPTDFTFMIKYFMDIYD